MNIFVLHKSPSVSARMLCDKHVVKMILETAQLLSTAWNICEPSHGMKLYKTTHKNHPCSIWARETAGNYSWLVKHYIELDCEYTVRYGKHHKSGSLMVNLIHVPPSLKSKPEMTPFCICMPEEYKIDNDPVKSYRNYYNKAKASFAKWTYTPIPEWFVGENINVV